MKYDLQTNVKSLDLPTVNSSIKAYLGTDVSIESPLDPQFNSQLSVNLSLDQTQLNQVKTLAQQAETKRNNKQSTKTTKKTSNTHNIRWTDIFGPQ